MDIKAGRSLIAESTLVFPLPFGPINTLNSEFGGNAVLMQDL